jgi:serine protease Do
MIKKLLSGLCMTICLIKPSYADGISAAEKVYKDVSESIFMVLDIHNNDFEHPVNFGSAVAVAKNILATNCHVTKHGNLRVVKVNQRLEPATLIYENVDDDMCFLKIASNSLHPVNLRAATTVRIGEEVFTIGSPKGYEKTIARGIISNKIKFKDTSILQTDAAISPGSSGGGLFDTKSHLIGITFSKNQGEGAEGLGFALPTEMIAAVLKKLML